MKIDAGNLDYKDLNIKIKSSSQDIFIDNCCGQRYIGVGLDNKNITINGTPGNALGAYLNGANIIVNGNVQDAVGDTMNDGNIIINGDAGDALGYAMRGGKIFVRGNAGYRTGIHMKQYKDKKPVITIGGKVGSFLGEYLAGGLIIVLGLNTDDSPISNFTGTGMHGGFIFIRSTCMPKKLPSQVTAEAATVDDLKEIKPYLIEYAEHFNLDANKLLHDKYYKLSPNAKNPYKKLYIAN